MLSISISPNICCKLLRSPESGVMARLVWARNQPMVSMYGTVARLHLRYILHASSDCCADDEQTLFHQLSRPSWLPEMSRCSSFPLCRVVSIDTTLHNHLVESRYVQDSMPPWSLHQLPGFRQAGAGIDALGPSIVTVVPVFSCLHEGCHDRQSLCGSNFSSKQLN